MEMRRRLNPIWGVQLILEGGDDSKVAAPASNPPEQVRVLFLARLDHLAIGGDDVCGEQIVAGETVLGSQVAEASA